MNVHVDVIKCGYCDRRAIMTVVVDGPTAVSRMIQQTHIVQARNSYGNLTAAAGACTASYVEDRCLEHLAGGGK